MSDHSHVEGRIDEHSCEEVRVLEAKLAAVRAVVDKWEYRPPKSMVEEVKAALGEGGGDV